MFQFNGDNICIAAPPNAGMIPPGMLDIVKRGAKIIEDSIVGDKNCDAIFQALPKGKSITDLFRAGINVHYDPSNDGQLWGWTMPASYPTDVVISQFTIRMGHWSIAGTIVHEMAHLAGADGTSHAAENTLQACKLKSIKGPYDPKIRG